MIRDGNGVIQVQKYKCLNYTKRSNFALSNVRIFSLNLFAVSWYFSEDSPDFITV
jgi:hypothetical protein